MKTIFVVDDSDLALKVAKHALSPQYEVLAIPSAGRMFQLLQAMTPDLILLDINMPDIDGFTALKKLKEDQNTENIPVMFLTSSINEETEVQGFELGAVDFVRKPFSKPVLLNRIATHLHINEIIKKRTSRIEQIQNGIIMVVSALVESRDELTGGHIERTSHYIKLLIDGMLAAGIYADEIKGWSVDTVVSSALLHDVGKIKIPNEILNKPGKLTPQEFDIMRTHTLIGKRTIDEIIEKTSEADFLQHAKLFAEYHHERWDGKGYPHGLKGKDIPLEGRIMAIADVYDALISDRPYKKAFSREETEKIILGDSGSAFDPDLIKVFIGLKDSFAGVVESYRETALHINPA